MHIKEYLNLSPLWKWSMAYCSSRAPTSYPGYISAMLEKRSFPSVRGKTLGTRLTCPWRVKSSGVRQSKIRQGGAGLGGKGWREREIRPVNKYLWIGRTNFWRYKQKSFIQSVYMGGGTGRFLSWSVEKICARQIKTLNI